ncbi:unconventional myosin-IXa-like isoform X2 [Sitophilus oryzae]|uniref:Unconventional myosin-IXa-like isoform X2 n=1 Tax=Sitophilus oryzae TaxID=7048 RepID=A0A6J2Y3S5_SITOR|nr:unconventional myosin-IXa-like isoform X2 [Sitophilus oryzae]
MMPAMENNRYILQVYVGALSSLYEALSVEASKQTTSEEIVACIVERLSLNENASYELTEVIGDDFGQECKERSLSNQESPVQLMMLWPKNTPDKTSYRFYLREKIIDHAWRDQFVMDPQLIKDYFHRFLYQPKDREYPDLCQLPDLNEQTLLDNLRARFVAGHIYTYVGSILIALNPFKFYPIYNPKYVKLYQNRRLGPNLPPHIFAVADTAYHCMLKDRKNQCIVISGESGSGKTESTNFLLHHLTALSQKGSHGSGVEQTILSAGPVLEAFGNAKTAHNNNSSRFGKFIQVNYKENGMVHGAVVQKYLLEKSRICCQGRYERNYHVFYYLLEGANEQEKQLLHLQKPDKYYYLNKSCSPLDNVDESYEFSRLKQSMEMVGFTPEKQRRLFSVLSAVLLLGNVEFQPRKSAYHHDEAVGVKNPEIVGLISELLRVKQETLMQALTTKRARASGETLVINYRLPDAIASRDAMAKCLYGALFDWIVLQVNHALLSKKDTLREHQGNSIGVLDIFGFEDFDLNNSFEQLCINYANEHLQYYFNQHVFKYEQEEYRKEGIRWTNIDFMDNTGCLQLIEAKPNGLLCLLDDQCNFPGATNETLLQKFNSVHKDNKFYKKPQKKEAAFIVEHYAGKVKYQVTDMREKNLDLMRQDIVGVLKNSSMAFVRELVGVDPVAVFRWAIVRAFFRAQFAFRDAGKRHRQGRVDGNRNNIQQRYRGGHIPNDNIISKQRTTVHVLNRSTEETTASSNRLSWPQFYQRNRSSTTNSAQKSSDEERKRRDSASNQSSAVLDRVLCPDEARAIHRANQIVMKNKSFRPRERGKKGLKNLQSVKTLAGRTGITATNQGQIGKARKQPMTVAAQFQQSLHSLMDTLNQANPFFIRCIKSNKNKIPNTFDADTVQRQLRYTGMLETVRIRQAGFNVRLTYDEFIQLYRILLPKALLSSQNDVRDFLATLNLNRDNYQLGSTKVFMRESEKHKLDCKLHQQIMAGIVTLQRWFRACLERKRFLRMKTAVVVLQSYCRMYLVQKALRYKMAALKIQKCWRGYKCRSWMQKLKMGLVLFQAHCRGFRVRQMMAERKIMGQHKLIKPQYKPFPIHVPIQVLKVSSDEAFMSKESSQEELRGNAAYRKFLDSDESSGFHEDYIDNNSTNSRLSLRSTVSLPMVSPTHPHYYSVYLNTAGSNRLEDLHLDPRRKIIKSHQTIDYSELEYSPQRKGSGESLDSQRSYESQQSSDSHPGGTTVKEVVKSEPSPLGKQWSSTSTTSETFSESGATQSAPPHIGEKFSQFQSSGESTGSPAKPQLTRTQAVNWNTGAGARKDLRNSGENSRALVRGFPARRLSRAYEDRPDVYPCDNTPSKLEQILGRPEAPVRSTRKSKRGHVKSLGEEVTDSGSIEKGGFLGVIDERKAQPDFSRVSTNFISQDSPNKQSLTPKRQRQNLPQLDLRRRNSDPATKVLLKDHNSIDASPAVKNSDKWSDLNTSIFQVAGHSLRKINRLTRDGLCGFCKMKIDLFITQGYKCTTCKTLFHTKCIQNKSVFEMPCESHNDLAKGKRKHRKHSRAPYDVQKSEEAKFSLTGTSEFTDRTDQIISGSEELTLMQEFITEKIMKIENEGGKSSEVDKVFKHALREFKDNLVQIYSTTSKHNGIEVCNVRYRDLIGIFNQAIKTACQRELKENETKNFPIILGVNAFRGFMDEFMSTKTEEKPNKTKRKKEKKRKVETVKINGHTFLQTIINIQTACEICNSFFMWPIERGLVCQSCKLTCHKRCCNNSGKCQKEPVLPGDNKKIFGVALITLVTEEHKIPVVIEKLIYTIELKGLYTEGIYRKSGVSSKIRELKVSMDENPENCEFEKYQVHVLASVLKCFLREMPEPLLTFEYYENFITAANLTNETDRITTLYDILKKLPQSNYDLMERIIFHLAMVAHHEETNRMSASALAIVFAPCVLRTNNRVPAQQSLHDIGSQTQCIETIIRVHLRKLRSTLEDIDTLDTACQAATNRLSSLRSSKVFSPDELLPSNQPSQQQTEDEEHLLEDHIQEIQKEKEHLASTLPTLTHATSDDDMLSTDGDGSLDDLSCLGDRNKPKPVVRSISTGESRSTSALPKLKRQSSSDTSGKMLEDCEDPIMV